MTDIASIGIRLTTDGLDRGVRSLDDLAARGPKVERAMHGVETSVASASAQLKAFAATALAGLSLASFAGKLVSVQREFDVLNSSLLTVTGSSAAAERELSWLKRFAAETPFGLAQATQGFVKMKALGLDPTKQSLTSFGNTAAAMGKNLNQMIEAVADASTSEFERLKEFGIKAKQDGDRVSLTFQGVTKNIGNNAKEIVQYLESIGNTQFAGSMELRAKTLDGTIATLGDSWDELARTVNETTGVTNLMKGSLESVTQAMDGVGAAMRANEPAIAAVMGALSGAVIGAGLAALPRAISAVGVAITGLAAIAAANPIALAILGVSALAGGALSAARAYTKTEDGIKESIRSLEEQNARSQESMQRAMDAGRAPGVDRIRQTIEERSVAIRALKKELQDLSSNGSEPLTAASFGLSMPKMPKVAEPPKADKAALAAAKRAAEDALQAQVALYRNADKAVLDSRQDFYTALSYEVKLGEKEHIQALGQGVDKEFEVWMQRSALLDLELSAIAKKKDTQKEQAVILGKLADLERDYSQAATKASNEIKVAVRDQTIAYREAEEAAKSYLANITSQNSRDLAGLGMGNLQREQGDRRNQRDDQYQGRKDDLLRQRQANQISETDYAKYLAIEATTHAQVLAADEAHWARRKELQGDWSLGASEALRNYADESANVFKQTETLMTNAFSGMEDALVKFATTGKLSFSDLATSIIADMIRIQARAAMSSALSSIFGLFTGGGSAGLGASAYSSMTTGLYMASGGYTGPGGIHEPAGVVHKGEVVWSQADVRKAGGVGVVEAMRLGKQGYDRGGTVGASRVAASAKARPAMSVTLSPTIHIDSRTDRADVERLVARGMRAASAQAQAELMQKMARGMA